MTEAQNPEPVAATSVITKGQECLEHLKFEFWISGARTKTIGEQYE